MLRRGREAAGEVGHGLRLHIEAEFRTGIERNAVIAAHVLQHPVNGSRMPPWKPGKSSMNGLARSGLENNTNTGVPSSADNTSGCARLERWMLSTGAFSSCTGMNTCEFIRILSRSSLEIRPSCAASSCFSSSLRGTFSSVMVES